MLFDDNWLRKERVGSEFINSDPEQDTHNSDPEQDTHHSDPDESCPVRREQRQVQSRSCLDSIRSCPDSIYFHARSETALQYREKIF